MMSSNTDIKMDTSNSQSYRNLSQQVIQSELSDSHWLVHYLAYDRVAACIHFMMWSR